MTYVDQLQRVRRFLNRIDNPNANSAKPLSPQEQIDYEDMLFGFFQNCWHLKDWIKNDITAPRTLSGPIETLWAQYQSLKLCADVANATKHLILNTSRVNGRLLRAIEARINESVVSGESTTEVRYEYKIADNAGNSHSAIAVARQAVSDWEKLITQNGGQI